MTLSLLFIFLFLNCLIYVCDIIFTFILGNLYKYILRFGHFLILFPHLLLHPFPGPLRVSIESTSMFPKSCTGLQSAVHFQGVVSSITVLNENVSLVCAWVCVQHVDSVPCTHNAPSPVHGWEMYLTIKHWLISCLLNSIGNILVSDTTLTVLDSLFFPFVHN